MSFPRDEAAYDGDIHQRNGLSRKIDRNQHGIVLPPRVVNRIAQALRMAAVSARRARPSSVPDRARLTHRDSPVAVNATARGPAIPGCTMVTRGEECVERGMAAHELQRAKRAVCHPGRRARQLGHRLAGPDESPDSVKSAA